MRYIPNSSVVQRDMLKEIGVSSLEELLRGIPAEIRLHGNLNLPNALSEAELWRRFKELENKNAPNVLSFLGAGVNQHYVPSAIDALISRSEFLTSYTPYQAEISQGTLQAIFEFQTFICQLTEMEVSNASLYDGSTALAEAFLMAARLTQRSRFLVAASIHPEFRQVVKSITRHQELTLDLLNFGEDGRVALDCARSQCTGDVAALVVQSPNFFGNIEELDVLAQLAHEAGALLIVNIAEAISFGLLKPPGEAGADIVCGEAQSLGAISCFGGPHLGFLATRDKFVRNMPGRLAGQTTDLDGKRGFVLTLSTREQHIRREKATSNICTNQSLCALIATIYLSLLGKSGVRQVALQNVAKTQYALEQFRDIPGVEVLFDSPRFNELVLRLPCPYLEIEHQFHSARVVPGFPLGRFYSGMNDCLLISITETKTRAEIDFLCRLLREISSKQN
jgi:glycine dehydrogenase subunit 1